VKNSCTAVSPHPQLTLDVPLLDFPKLEPDPSSPIPRHHATTPSSSQSDLDDLRKPSEGAEGHAEALQCLTYSDRMKFKLGVGGYLTRKDPNKRSVGSSKWRSQLPSLRKAIMHEDHS